MKTYAIVQTPAELRDKLARYYRHNAERLFEAAKAQHLKRNRDRDETQARLYNMLADELDMIVIQSDAVETLQSAMFL